MGDIRLLNGGYEFSSKKGANKPITPVNVKEVIQCIDDIDDNADVAVCGIFSPDKHDQEIQVLKS